MTAQAAATTRPTHTARRAALVLLVVLSLGFAVMTFTRGWIADLPQHDHLGSAAEAAHIHGHIHHAHEGDDLARTLAELLIVATPLEVLTLEEALAASGGTGVIVLSPLVAQSDLSTFSANAAFLAIIVALCLVQGARLSPLTRRGGAGQTRAPLTPPPRAA